MFRALQPDVALLGRAHAAARRALVFQDEFETPLAPRFASWLRCRDHFFLDRFFLAANRHGSWLVSRRRLHGDLLRALVFLLRLASARCAEGARETGRRFGMC